MEIENNLRYNEWFNKNCNYNYLYHFTSIDSFIKILVTEKFRLSCINKMNDVNESLAIFEKFSSFNKEQRIIKHEKYIRERTFLGCFNVLKENEDIRDKVSMWGYYADSCKGICMEIDKRKLDERIWGLIWDEKNRSINCEIHIDKFKIKYKKQSDINEQKKRLYKNNMGIYFTNMKKSYDNEFDRLIDELDSEIPKCNKGFYMTLKELFSMKSDEWISENEFRYLVYNASSNDINYFEFNDFSSVINKVYVGEMQDKESIKLLRNIKSKLLPNIDFSIRVNDSEVEIDSKEIDKVIL